MKKHMTVFLIYHFIFYGVILDHELLGLEPFVQDFLCYIKEQQG